MVPKLAYFVLNLYPNKPNTARSESHSFSRRQALNTPPQSHLIRFFMIKVNPFKLLTALLNPTLKLPQLFAI